MQITDVQVKVEVGETYRILMSGPGRWAVQRLGAGGEWTGPVETKDIPKGVRRVITELNALYATFGVM